MEFGNDEIRDIAMNVWSAMFDTELRLADVPEGRFRENGLTSCVLISGAWEGAVTVLCGKQLATRLAAQMFALEPEAVSAEEISDGLGEIANMCGGNFKALLPAPSHLSLPAVIDGGDYTLNVPGSRMVHRVGFDCGGEPLVVVVFMRERAPVRQASQRV
jgi:chemotaxis protein CheX